MFQDYAVWPHLSVWDNVCYPMKKHKVPKEEIAKRAAYALEQVRMTGYEKHMPAQLMVRRCSSTIGFSTVRATQEEEPR